MGVGSKFTNTTPNSVPHLSDKWGTHSSALFGVKLALGQWHTLRGSAEKLGAWSVNNSKMHEVAGGQLQHTEVVAQGRGRASKGDGALPAEHPGEETPQSLGARGKDHSGDSWGEEQS